MEINSKKNTTKVFMKNKEFEMKTETRGHLPTKDTRRHGPTGRPCHLGPFGPWWSVLPSL
jgi:hypothetical protein